MSNEIYKEKSKCPFTGVEHQQNIQLEKEHRIEIGGQTTLILKY